MLAVNLAAGVIIHSYYIWSYESPNVTFSIAQGGLLFPEFTSQSVAVQASIIQSSYPPFGVLASSFVAIA
jgi:hypothetical protein